jgi:hypothetical protein
MENKFLKICGILMIIGGIIGILGGILLLAGAGLLSAVAEEANVEVNESLLTFASIFAAASGVVSLIAGILGVKYAARPEKANICIVFGILVIVISVIGNVIGLVGGGDFQPLNLLTGLIVPVLYLIGAFQSKGTIRS